MSESLQPHGLQHTRLLCPPLPSGVCSDSCPLSQWCYLTISSSEAIFFCLQSFSAPGSSPVSQCFTSGGQSVGSFSFSNIPSNEYSQLPSFRTDWFDLLAVQETLKSLLQHHNYKALIVWCSAFFVGHLSHLYMTTVKPWLWLYGPLLATWYLTF